MKIFNFEIEDCCSAQFITATKQKSLKFGKDIRPILKVNLS